MAKLIAICAGGLETLVIEDIKRAAPSNVQVEQVSSGKNVSNCIQVAGLSVNRGESGCGKILVSNVLDFEFLDKVRSVQTWLVFMVESASVPSSASKGIGYIQNLVSQSVDLSGALATWERCLVASSVQKYQDLITKARPPKFCVRCIRDGEHEYSSLDVSRKVGESVLANTNWSVDLCNMDFEIIVLILSETMLIGINIPTLSPPFLKSKLPGEVRPPVVPSGLTSGLRPSTAYLLVALAHPEPGDILVDAMCGCGATFIEAAYSHGCIAIGGDVDQELLPTLRQSLQQTAQMSFNKAVAELAWWGAPKLPVRDGSVDIVMLDLPFGKVSKKVPKHYARARVPKHVTELARVLRPSTGRCVLLVQSHQHLVACLDSAYFCDIKVIGVNIGGYICSVVVAQRTSKEFQLSYTVPVQEVEEIIVGVKRPADIEA